MRELEMTQVLSQIRALSTRAAGLPAANATAGAAAPPAVDFGKVLTGTLDKVNGQQVEAAQMAQSFELGKADIASVMLAMQKAQVSFKAVTEVRNKLVQAYQDIMNMPV